MIVICVDKNETIKVSKILMHINAPKGKVVLTFRMDPQC